MDNFTDYICTNLEDLCEKLTRIISSTHLHNREEAIKEQYKFVVKHVLFTASLNKCLTPQNLPKEVRSLVEKQSSPKNIAFYSLWSREQLGLMDSNTLRVIFTSNWGTGKTKMMVCKAMNIAESCEDSILIFVIYDGVVKSLASLDIQLQFENIRNVTVIPLQRDGCLVSILEEVKNRKGRVHVFVDEFNAESLSVSLPHYGPPRYFYRGRQVFNENFK